MKDTYRAGLFCEWVARQILRLCGFRILESRRVTGRNTGRAEIDIVARRGGMMLFVEVKNRRTAAEGLGAISRAQARRLRSAAEAYLRRRSWLGLARFDVIVVGAFGFRWFRNAI
jgi:putative endonuclease